VNSARGYFKEQKIRPIFNGRPTELHGPPIEIYNKTLAKLKDDLNDLSKAPDPPMDTIVQTGKLFHASAPIFSSEDLRIEGILSSLTKLLDADLENYVKTFKGETNKTCTEGDAAIRMTLQDQSHGTKVAVVAYIEFKNELGLRGEGGLQGALSLRKHVAHKDVRLLGLLLTFCH
jgi:hypothetical protein